VSESLALTGAAEARDPLEERLVGEIPALRAFLLRLAGSPARRGEVDDLVQETLARALRYGASFDAARPLGPWLRATALRLLIDQRRGTGVGLAELGADAPAEERGDALEQRDSVTQALSALGRIEREVLIRFHARGESIRTIARALGTPEGTIKSHLHRARRRLADRFGEEGRA
jgi:RNA polymerase sigma-70 factor (ECF subfamily)